MVHLCKIIVTEILRKNCKIKQSVYSVHCNNWIFLFIFFLHRLKMAPQTRSMRKILAQVDPHFHVYLDPTHPLPQRMTRSVGHNLKILGISIPKHEFPARIVQRRQTCQTPKPARRAVRFQTTHGKIIFLRLRFHNVKTLFCFKIVFNSHGTKNIEKILMFFYIVVN